MAERPNGERVRVISPYDSSENIAVAQPAIKGVIVGGVLRDALFKGTVKIIRHADTGRVTLASGHEPAVTVEYREMFYPPLAALR